MVGLLEFLAEPGVSSFINILLIMALVLVTAYYAKKVRDQTELMRKDRERHQILDEVKKILSPSILDLERDIEALKKGSFRWFFRHTGEGVLGLGKLETYHVGKIALEDLINKNPRLGKAIAEHNKLIPPLEKELRKLADKMITPEFQKECETRAIEFNRNNQEQVVGDLSKIHMQVLSNVINNRKILEKEEGHIEPFKDFYNENSENFFKIREDPPVKEKLNQINSAGGKVKEAKEELNKKLKEIREKYRKEYSLTEEELNLNYYSI